MNFNILYKSVCENIFKPALTNDIEQRQKKFYRTMYEKLGIPDELITALLNIFRIITTPLSAEMEYVLTNMIPYWLDSQNTNLGQDTGEIRYDLEDYDIEPFDKIVKLISTYLEFNNIKENVFKSVTPEENERRKEQYKDIVIKEWIEKFLKRDDIIKNSDGSYDVKGNVNLYNMSLTKLPVRFNRVGGYFDCSYNQLTTLEGSPKTVSGYFDCSNNQLTSLEGSPKEVGGSFSCYRNKLTSLEGSPKTVGGNFWVQYNTKKFTEEDVRAVSEVKGIVHV